MTALLSKLWAVLSKLSVEGWLVVALIIVCVVGVFKYNALANEKAALDQQVKVTAANDSTYRDSVTKYIASQNGLLVTAQRDLYQQSVVLDSNQATIAKGQKVSAVFQDSIKVLGKVLAMKDSIKPIHDSTEFVYADSLDGPSVLGHVRVEIPFSPDTANPKPAVISYALRPAPFTVTMNIGCPVNTMAPPVLTATTPSWITMQIERGTIDPRVCTPIQPSAAFSITPKHALVIGAPAFALGILLRSLW